LRTVSVALACAGCSFQARALDGDARPSDGRSSDAAHDAATLDAPPPLPYFYGVSADQLYRIDGTTHAVTQVGQITDGSTVFPCDGLAGDGRVLLAIPQTHDRVLTLDPATAAVTANVALSATHGYWGFTMAPAGALGAAPVWFLASNGSGEPSSAGRLYTLDPASGAVTLAGAFGGGMTIEGDIAWVPGHGLYASLVNGSCNPLCIATLDTSLGVASVLEAQAASALHAMSGYGGQLWAFDGGGQGWAVDLASGATTTSFTTGGIDWYDAAP